MSLTNNIPYWFHEELKPEPVAVWTYPSNTLFNIYRDEEKNVPKHVLAVFEAVKEKALASGKFRWDNKLVIQCRISQKGNSGTEYVSYICLGYKDGYLSLGLGAWNLDGIEPIVL